MTTYEAKKLFQDFFGRIHDDEKAAETRKAQMKEQAKALESKLAALKRLLNLGKILLARSCSSSSMTHYVLVDMFCTLTWMSLYLSYVVTFVQTARNHIS